MWYIIDRLRSVKQKRVKMEKIKFYTDSNQYRGYSKGRDYLELRSWILSGNYLVVDNKKVSTIKKLNKIFFKKNLTLF